MRLLGNVPSTDGTINRKIPVGQWGGFLVFFNLTAAAGVTLTRAQLGNIRLNWGGNDIINLDAEMLNLLDNLYCGVAQFASAAAGACTMAVFIPCGVWWDAGNIYDVSQANDVYLQCDFPTIANVAVCASGTVAIYGVEKLGVMNYLYHLVVRQEIASGADLKTNVIALNNMSQLYLKSASTLLTNIQVSKNNKVYVDCPITVYNCYSDWLHLLETTNTTLAIEFCETRSIYEAVGGHVGYSFQFSGAGTQSYYCGWIEWTNQKAIESQAKASLEVKNRVGVVTR